MEIKNYSESDNWKWHHQMAEYYRTQADMLERDIKQIRARQIELLGRAATHQRISEMQVEWQETYLE